MLMVGSISEAGSRSSDKVSSVDFLERHRLHDVNDFIATTMELRAHIFLLAHNNPPILN
jgi:hypothetical protein